MARKNITPSREVHTSKVVHIGLERHAKMTKIAIDISYQLGIQVTPRQIVQYLIDHYSDKAAAGILRSHGSRDETDKET